MRYNSLTSDHEDLNGVNDQDIVDVETSVRVVEREETIEGQLGSKVVVLSTELLFTHTHSKLGLEVKDGTETKITTLSALVVLDVLDASTTAHGRHTGENILVQVQTLLRLRDASTRAHERRVQKIGVTVV